VSAAALRFYSGEGHRDQGDDRQRSQTEVDVYVRQQPALGNHVGLEKLKRAERRVAAATAVMVDQIRILRQRGSGGGVQTIGDVQQT